MRRASWSALIGPLTLLSAALLIGNVIVFAAWTAPRWSARLGVAGGGGSVAAARARIEPALRVTRDTYGRLESAERDLDAFRDRLIADVPAAGLLGMLDAAGDDVGIDLDDATLQYQPLDELGVLQLGITFPVSGSYEAIRRLLDELAGLPLFLVIDGVGLQSFGSGPPGSAQTIRVDLAVSVFLQDRELVAPAVTTQAAARPLVGPRRIEALRRALEDDDPDEIADAVLAALDDLPQLPVDSRALVVDLDAIDTPVATSEARRNLFSVVLPPAPEPEAIDEAPVFIEPEPTLPVRLLGIVLRDGRWHASVTDEQRIFVVKAGDRLPNGVEIVDVGKDYAEFSYQNRNTILNLEGTRP